VDPSRRLEKGPRGRFPGTAGKLALGEGSTSGDRLVTCPRRVELFITGERKSGQRLHEPGKLDVIIIDLAFASLNSTRNGAGKESDSRHG
jgi:hypothetical protein